MIKSQEEIELNAVRKFMNTMFFEGIVLSRFDTELRTYIPLAQSTTELYYQYVNGK